jgi:hypothetical protein
VLTPVPRLWPGATIVCCGSGPSLSAGDVFAVRQAGLPIIAVNDAYRLAPEAGVIYAADVKWWRWHWPTVRCLPGLKYGLMPEVRNEFPEVGVILRTGDQGLETRPIGVRSGGHGGYQAVNLAVHLGAQRIVLLGYDMQAEEGRDHFFGAHPDGSHPRYEKWLTRYETLAEPLRDLGISIVNASRRSALTAFPRRELAEVLCSL